MSINKIPLVPSHGATTLPFNLEAGEILQFQTGSTRQGLVIDSKQSSVNRAVHITGAGKLYLTNTRFIYITHGQGDLASFSIKFADLKKIQFSHAVKSPWFGPNYWSFMLYSASDSSCDGLPENEWFQGSISFKDGGLFEFVASFDRVLTDTIDNPHIDDELPRYSDI